MKLNSTYDSFKYYQDINQELTWEIKGPLSKDLVAGLLVAMTILFSVLDEDYNKTLERPVVVINKTRIDLYDTPSIYELLKEYIIDTREKDEIITKPDIFSRVNKGYFGWWIFSTKFSNINRYKLYTFRNSDFVRGFISMCKAFNVEFRNYILGSPFTDSKLGRVYYTIKGYDIEPIPHYIVPVSVSPFYTNIYEADPFGLDYV